MEAASIRVRFAPSPTGPLHLGGVRTALYNYLFAKNMGGTFILRIEDTDRTRFVPTAEEYILNSFSWCGIEFDEDPVKGGSYGPYRQSERSDIYRKYAGMLIENGTAYYAFDTEDELDEMRQKHDPHEPFQYDCTTRTRMKNSLTLPLAETQQWIASGKPYVVRLKVPVGEDIRFSDLIRGEIVVKSEHIDDKILFKSDGLPTYHLANVVDDHLMRISHVIRGEEWLPSAPLHVLLYKSFGWSDTMPYFAHLPLILKPDGNGKLSKRDGDRLGFPVFPLTWTDPLTHDISKGYKDYGFLPDAFLNMLALLGWNPGNDLEIMSLNDMIKLFSMDRIGKSGAKFDWEKARWINHQYLSHRSDEELASFLAPVVAEHGIRADDVYLQKVCSLVRERVFLTTDLWDQSWFFFKAPEQYDMQVVQKIWQEGTSRIVADFASQVALMGDLSKDSLHQLLQDYTTSRSVKTGALMNPLRLLTVGSNQGPGMMDIAETIGKSEFLARIEHGLKKLLILKP